MSPIIDYAPRTRWTFVRRNRRRFAVGLILSIIACASYRYRQGIHDYIAWRYYFRQCMRHVTPPNTSLSLSLTTAPSGGDYVPVVGRPVTYIYIPRVFVQLRQVDARTQSLWRDEPVIFLGKLTRPDGEERLVIISGEWTSPYAFTAGLRMLVLAEPKWNDKTFRSTLRVQARAGNAKGMALEPAQKDGADPTHLTVRFHVPAWKHHTGIYHKGIIDIYLQNDDSLRFVVRENVDVPKYGRIRPGEYIVTGSAN